MTQDADATPKPRPDALTSLALVLATGFGSGYSPVVPGTAGSLVGLVLFLPVHSLAPVPLLLATLLVIVTGIVSAGIAARAVGKEDPGIVVIDEVAGMWITLLFLPLTPLTAAAGFVLFRILDVVKPFPARRLEDLPGGYGIMCDDLMAGLYGNLLLRGLLLLWPHA